MAPRRRFHSLTEAELVALATGNYTAREISLLQAAQFSRNALLVESLRRGARAAGYSQVLQVIESATRILSEVQVRHPDVVSRMLVLPHFGFWAADCLIRLQDSAAHGRSLADETQVALCHIATFAAAAALLAGHPFELPLPIREGIVHLPSIGCVTVGDKQASGYAQARLDQSGTGLIIEYDRLRIPLLMGAATIHAKTGWAGVSRLNASWQGLSVNLLLDDLDPFLAQIGPASPRLSRQSVAAWSNIIHRAWRILVRENKSFAQSLATGLTTLIPLRQSHGDRPMSAASGWAWSAIALTLPPDPLTFAETLIHEFQHLVLSAIEDIAPLTNEGDEGLYYSPWRDDPRPISSILQGAYAFFGVTGFWQQHRKARSSAARHRSEVAYALRRHNVMESVAVLSASAGLTETGQIFLRAMRRSLSDWSDEKVSDAAESAACEVDAEHRIRWRLANLRPSEAVVDTLARAWLAQPAVMPSRVDVPTVLLPAPTFGLVDRSSLLEGQPGWPGTPDQGRPDAAALAPGDLALWHGDLTQAERAYLQRIAEDADLNAWIGLMLVLRRTGALDSGWSVHPPIEVVVAVAERARTMTGHKPDARALFRWISAACGQGAPLTPGGVSG